MLGLLVGTYVLEQLSFCLELLLALVRVSDILLAQVLAQ